MPALPAAPSCAAGFGFKNSQMGRIIHRLAAPVEVTTLYQIGFMNGASTCQPRALSMPRSYFTLGENIPPTMFVERLTSRVDGPPGQRMQYLYDDLADGTRLMNSLTTLWDSKLEIFCRGDRADDGWLRCLPTVAMATSTFMFTDPKCTRTAAFSARQPPEKLAVQADGQGCSVTRRIFRVGPKLEGTMYRIVGERCTATPLQENYYALGDELRPEDFAPLRPALATTGRLQERYLVDDAGIAQRENVALWDSLLGQLCSFDHTAMGRRCVPLGWAGLHADSTCTSRAARAFLPLCGAPAPAAPAGMVSTSAGPWCAPQAVPTALGAVLGSAQMPAAPYLRTVAGACTAGSSPDGNVRRLADAVDLGMFVPGAEAMD